MYLPGTSFGKWSVLLIVATPLFLFAGSAFASLFYRLVPAGNTLLEDFVRRPALACVMFLGMTAGIFAFMTGMVAIVRHKERALMVYGATALGALLLLFFLGEFIFPH